MDHIPRERTSHAHPLIGLALAVAMTTPMASDPPVPVETPWGLDRIDQRSLPLDGRFESDYVGTDQHIYLLSSGVDAQHPQLRGRVVAGPDLVGDGDSAKDCHGSGTAVASVAAGTTLGVAPQAVVHSIRVLNCEGNGSSNGTIAGMRAILDSTDPLGTVFVQLGMIGTQDEVATLNALIEKGHSVVAIPMPSPVKGPMIDPSVSFVDGATMSDEQYWVPAHNFANIHGPAGNIPAAVPGGGVEPSDSGLLAAAHVAGVHALMREKLGPSRDIGDAVLSHATEGALKEPLQGPVLNRLVHIPRKDDVINPEPTDPHRPAPDPVKVDGAPFTVLGMGQRSSSVSFEPMVSDRVRLWWELGHDCPEGLLATLTDPQSNVHRIDVRSACSSHPREGRTLFETPLTDLVQMEGTWTLTVRQPFSVDRVLVTGWGIQADPVRTDAEH